MLKIFQQNNGDTTKREEVIICGLRKNIKKVNRNICRARKSKCKSKNRKEVIQMKRKLDPNKIYAFIGRAVTFLTTIVLLNIANYYLAIYILDNCITVYR